MVKVSQSDSCTIRVKVVPGANRTELVGEEGGFLKVRLVAPAIEGRANRALVDFFSTLLSVPRTCVRIKSGASSRHKLVQVIHCSPERVLSLFKSKKDAP